MTGRIDFTPPTQDPLTTLERRVWVAAFGTLAFLLGYLWRRRVDV